MKLIPISERGNYQCASCGITKSVKYFIKTPSPVGFIGIPVCNRCALGLIELETTTEELIEDIGPEAIKIMLEEVR